MKGPATFQLLDALNYEFFCPLKTAPGKNAHSLKTKQKKKTGDGNSMGNIDVLLLLDGHLSKNDRRFLDGKPEINEWLVTQVAEKPCKYIYICIYLYVYIYILNCREFIHVYAYIAYILITTSTQSVA